ncbi:MAG: NAD(P)/FAD-dependent oxidoreductase [Gammaproteobacteria bacterium]
MSTQPFVVVGAGQAGLQVCDSLRKGGYEGPLVLCGEEGVLPYQRPPLSKKFLGGELDPARLLFRPESYYEKLDVELRLGDPAVTLDRERCELALASGATLHYAKLALATGTRVRPIDCPGSDHAEVYYVRTLADGERLRARLGAARRIAVVGGGFIGLEVAAMARGMGLEVVVIEALERLMARAVSAQVSAFYADYHRDQGVDLRLGEGVEGFDDADDGLVVRLGGGDSLRVDAVVVGIGVVPNDELARASGLACDNGIVVDEFAATADENIVAAGDCTMHYNGFLDRSLRLESVQNAVDQAKVAAATMLGHKTRYCEVPWFWSDQYDLKLQMAGIGAPHDESALRGEIGSEGFSIFYFRDGQLTGADSVNRPAEHMACRRLLQQGTLLTPAQAADPAVNLMELARR